MSFLEEEDFGDYTVEYDNRCKLDTEDCLIAKDSPILISYFLVDMEVSKYSFGQDFTQKETKGYFESMAYFSGRTINQIIDETGHELHFYRSNIRGNLYKLLKQIWPKRKIDRDNTLVYHFALYDSKNRASRKSGVRNPRVYFMLGKEGVIYPIFFDPFHEINPTDY